jgi:UDP-N-acetylmuramate: L-alanyl-gamma-D-glutamyl-meso-diaminopimelate ligase
MHGLHNVENATGATAICLRLGLTAAELEKGFASFAGVRRRQELVTTAGGIALVDDFAHHPTAVIETINAIAARYPGRKLWALFEPRSNTASRAIHQHEYEHAFNRADEVIFSTPKKIDSLAPGEALNPAAIAEAISKAGKRARFFPSVDEILKTVIDEAKPGDVILTMSNGAFGGLVPKLKAALESRA